ncbi:MAG: nicotinamide riboside transporter PnuC, partial [Prevotellaceae bacterium]|nr:nicotinamide riboside transporter PnuC [Prevotellaceae bacterium]
LALVLLGISGGLFAGMSFVLKNYTDSPVPFGDALTTALSIVATWMLAHKIIEQWWMWLFINVVSAMLYTWRGLYPTAFLFCCYAVASVIGYYSWKKKS